MNRSSQRRPGVTLIEVLIATGILAVGMLAIMALFPIGAVSMARAINQNRCADHGANSDAIFRFYWKKTWIDSNSGDIMALDGPTGALQVSQEPMLTWLDSVENQNPRAVVRAIQPTNPQPSFVVVVDPIGYMTQPSTSPNPPVETSQNYIGGTQSLPRRTTLLATQPDPPPRNRIRLTTLLDDMTFEPGGEPATYTGQVERAGRYNVAWVIQRPRNDIPYEVRLVALVFAGRSPTDTPSAEDVRIGTVTGYADGVDPKPNTVTVSLNNSSKPAVRRGTWVALSLSVTPSLAIGTPVPFQTLDFYRVTGINEDTSNPNNTVLTLEFEQPLRSYAASTISGNNGGTFSPLVVFFDNLYEVFDRGTVSATAISGR